MKPVWQAILAIPGVVALMLVGMVMGGGPDFWRGGGNQDLAEIKKSQVLIAQQLTALNQMLQGARGRSGAPSGPPKNVTISTAGAHAIGKAGAKVTLVEFADYQCPFCARHFRSVMPRLKREYVDTGKLRYVLRDFPLASIHPAATMAAVAARCAGDQGKYMEMHDLFYKDQKRIKTKDWQGYGKEVKLDMDSFNRCLKDPKREALVKKDIIEGARAGVRGTPSFFIGLTGADGATLKNPVFIRGAQPFQAFQQAIEGLLAKPAG